MLETELAKLTAEHTELVHKIGTIQTQARAQAQLVYQRQRRRMPEEVSKARTALSALKKRIVTQWSVDEPLQDMAASETVAEIHESDDSDTVAHKRGALRRQLASGLARELYAEVDSDDAQMAGEVADQNTNERYELKVKHEELRRELQETLEEDGNRSKMMTLDWKWKIVHAMYEAQVRDRSATAAKRWLHSFQAHRDTSMRRAVLPRSVTRRSRFRRPRVGVNIEHALASHYLAPPYGVNYWRPALKAARVGPCRRSA